MRKKSASNMDELSPKSKKFIQKVTGKNFEYLNEQGIATSNLKTYRCTYWKTKIKTTRNAWTWNKSANGSICI